MTQANIALRDAFTFPVPADIERFTLWYRDPAQFRPQHPGRPLALRSVQGLTERLGLHQDFHHRLPQLLGNGNGNPRGGRFGMAPDAVMRQELYRTLRYHGYICPGADGLERVPLTGLQLHILRGVAHGRTTSEMEAEIGARAGSMRDVMTRMFSAHGCTTRAQMVGCAYRNGWLPGHTESRDLLTMSKYLMAPGYLRRLESDS